MTKTSIFLICLLFTVVVANAFLRVDLRRGSYPSRSVTKNSVNTDNTLPVITGVLSEQTQQNMINNISGPLLPIGMVQIPPVFLNEEQKARLTREIIDNFISADRVIVRYWRCRSWEQPLPIESIVLDDRPALLLFADSFSFSSDVSHSVAGVPGSPSMLITLVFTRQEHAFVIDLRPHNVHTGGMDWRIGYSVPLELVPGYEQELGRGYTRYRYSGLVSFDFVLFWQYYFGNIIDKYGEFNGFTGRVIPYPHLENQNEYIGEKLAEFSRVVLPLHIPDEH